VIGVENARNVGNAKTSFRVAACAVCVAAAVAGAAVAAAAVAGTADAVVGAAASDGCAVAFDPHPASSPPNATAAADPAPAFRNARRPITWSPSSGVRVISVPPLTNNLGQITSCT
jgi:hypothetical protein